MSWWTQLKFLKQAITLVSPLLPLMEYFTATFQTRTYYNANKLKSKVKKEVKVEQDADSTRIDLAMDLVLKDLFSSAGGDRPNARNILLIFTDGNPVFINKTWDDKPEIKLSSFPEKLKKKDVAIWVIGIGLGAENHRTDMEKIAGDEGHVYIFDDFTTFRENFLKEFKKRFCGERNLQAASARKPAECADEPAFERECRKRAKDKRFCWDNQDFSYLNCPKSCELCTLP